MYFSLHVVFMRGNDWVFTINNYGDDAIEILRSLVSRKIASYIVFGTEVGESGTPHLQGFV